MPLSFKFNKQNPFFEKGVVLVDFSWVLHKNFYALKSLSVVGPDGRLVPTGHVFGTFLDIHRVLSNTDKAVILVLDSHSPKQDKFPEFKGQREKPAYNIYNDQYPLLQILTSFPNVFYLKKEGYEVDDLILSLVWDGYNPVIFGNDVDLLTGVKSFTWSKKVTPNGLEFSDVSDYLYSKYGMVSSSHLPLWWLVVRGKPSNNIRASIPRLPSKTLISLCSALRDTVELDDFLSYCHFRGVDKNKNWDLERVKRNYEMVKFLYTPVEVVKKTVRDTVAMKQYIFTKRLDFCRKVLQENGII